MLKRFLSEVFSILVAVMGISFVTLWIIIVAGVGVMSAEDEPLFWYCVVLTIPFVWILAWTMAPRLLPVTEFWLWFTIAALIAMRGPEFRPGLFMYFFVTLVWSFLFDWPLEGLWHRKESPQMEVQKMHSGNEDGC